MTALTNVTFSPGTVITSDWLNGINDALNFKTAVKVTRNTSQTINDVTYTKLEKKHLH
mgnify:FL=1